MKTIQVCGISTLDIVHTLDSMPSKPEKYVSGDATMVVGGCAANAAIAIARLGGNATLVSRVGEDQAGQLILNQLQHEGVDCSQIAVTENARTPFSSILVDASGERQIVNFRGRHLQETHRADGGENTVHATLVDSRWMSAAMNALELANRSDIPGIIDAEPPISDELLDLATHIAFSRQGLLQYTGQNTIDSGLRSASMRHDKWICVTDGDQGCFTIDADVITRIPALDVPVVDTLGAGDVWHGAFAIHLADGHSELDCIHFANAASALKCTKTGGGDGAPTLMELEEFLGGDAYQQTIQ